MIAGLFLVIQLFVQSQSEVCKGDFPNATEVMTLLNRTYMLQSQEHSPNMQCAYQIFYHKSYRNELREKYDYVVQPQSRKPPLHKPMYVWRVANSTIYLSSQPEFEKDFTQLDILFSDLKSCIVTKGPDLKDIPKACRLWLTENFFTDPLPECTRGFERHCESIPMSYFHYNITGCTDLNVHN
uniref:Putative lipocalin n=1 Tax=Ixodes ricinus TaxID=34613 RepID=A0A6B0V0E2_IXORI